MKKVAYICFALVFLGCANVSEEKSFATSDMAENEATESAPINIEEAFPYATITQQKLQDYFDLVVLKNKHPEFAKTISEQLLQITRDSIVLPKGQDSVDVKNLKPIGDLFTRNDTLKYQKFEYTLASGNSLKTDTLTAYIISKTITIEGKPVVSTKVTLGKE